MKNIFIAILFITSGLYAAGGDTLRWSTAVRTLADGDTFFAAQHWGSLRDTIGRVVNGRLGDINFSATANISPAKLDTTKVIRAAGIVAGSGSDTLAGLKIITGTTGAADTTTINYPTGFTQTNTQIISFLLWDGTNWQPAAAMGNWFAFRTTYLVFGNNTYSTQPYRIIIAHK